ncbi:hypothetical protein D3C75_1291600 [compost metagenome]
MQVGEHRGVNDTGANGVYSNSASGVLNTCTFGQSDHTVFGRVIGGTTGLTYQSTKR